MLPNGKTQSETKDLVKPENVFYFVWQERGDIRMRQVTYDQLRRVNTDENDPARTARKVTILLPHAAKMAHIVAPVKWTMSMIEHVARCFIEPTYPAYWGRAIGDSDTSRAVNHLDRD